MQQNGYTEKLIEWKSSMHPEETLEGCKKLENGCCNSLSKKYKGVVLLKLVRNWRPIIQRGQKVFTFATFTM
jgi:hypothetical protein